MTKSLLPIQDWINRVHQGDCLSLMEQLPPESVDLIVTSPPYNLRNTTGGGLQWKNNNRWAGLADKQYTDHDDAMDHDEYCDWQRRCLASMLRLLPDTGAIFYVHKWRVQGGLLQDRADIVDGFPVRQIIIWHRSGGMNFNLNYFLPTYEVIYLIAKPEFRLNKRGGHREGDVWNISQEQGNPHPASFPLELARRCVQTTSARVVLDPFLGSGNTAIAADRCGRDYIGIDISGQYCDMARDRLRARGCHLWLDDE